MGQQSQHAVLGEVLELVGIRIESGLEIVVTHRSAHGHAGIDAATGKEIDGREVFGETKRVLESERDHRGAEFDPTRAHRRCGEHRDGRRDSELQVPVAQPDAVESEFLCRLDGP